MKSLEDIILEMFQDFLITPNNTINLIIIIILFILMWRITRLVIGNDFISFGVSILIIDILYGLLYLSDKIPDKFIAVVTFIFVFNFIYLIVVGYRIILEKGSGG